jgi:hypothetical protein
LQQAPAVESAVHLAALTQQQKEAEIERKPCVCVKDRNPSTISTRHVEAKCKHTIENQNNQNSSKEIEDLMLKGHPLPQIS